jgi:hypothetical protein
MHAQRHGSSEMPHLHLPIDHTEDDLVLAANVADVVGSADLYVAWSHESGAGAVPEVEAVLREETAGDNPFGEFFRALGAVFTSFWRALLGRRPAHGPAHTGPQTDRPRAGEAA